MTEIVDLDALKKIIHQAKKIAKEYRQLSGKPLGITGEVGEYIAAELLHLELTAARNPGYDALDDHRRKIQIKSRCILPGAKPGQRIGRIRLDLDCDAVLLVLMDGDFEPLEIYEAKYSDVKAELEKVGSISRNVRGALGISKFKSIGKKVWTRSPDSRN